MVGREARWASPRCDSGGVTLAPEGIVGPQSPWLTSPLSTPPWPASTRRAGVPV